MYNQHACNIDKDLDILENKLNEIESFLKQYNITKKRILIYINIGNIFFRVNKYTKAYLYYLKAYENCNNLDNIDLPAEVIFRKLCHTCYLMDNYTESLKYCSIGLHQVQNLSTYGKFMLEYNSALYLKKLNKFEKSLKLINLIEKDFKELLKEKYDDNFELLTLKGNCLTEQKHCTEALKVHKTLLKSIDKKDLEKKIVANCNITEAYVALNDKEHIQKYLDKTIKLLRDFDGLSKSWYTPYVYYSIGESFKTLNNFECTKKYYHLCLDISKHRKLIPITEDILNKLVELCIQLKDLKYINKLKNEILEIVSIKMISKNHPLIFKLINFYNDINEREKIQDMLTFLLDEAS